MGEVAESLRAGVERMLHDTPYAGPVGAGRAGGQSMTDSIRWLRAAAHTLASEIQPIIDGLAPAGLDQAARHVVGSPAGVTGIRGAFRGRAITSTVRPIVPGRDVAPRGTADMLQRIGTLSCGQVFALAFFFMVLALFPALPDAAGKVSFMLAVVSLIIGNSRR
jgi:hypothetical protein